jgi:hypothetical protein
MAMTNALVFVIQCFLYLDAAENPLYSIYNS